MLRRLAIVETSPKRDPVAPAHRALRDGLRRFVARRVRPDQVDDLMQDIVLRMQEHAGQLRDEERVAGWAFRIAQSVVADHYRLKRALVSLDETNDPPEEAADEANLNDVVASWLRPMLVFLPAEYAEALERVELQGVSQRDYAAEAGLSISGAKSRVQRARSMLEGVVRACCDLELDARGNVIGYTRKSDGHEGGGT
jgi:RNA polymerase sigma-70 factor, ECF subfamily